MCGLGIQNGAVKVPDRSIKMFFNFGKNFCSGVYEVANYCFLITFETQDGGKTWRPRVCCLSLQKFCTAVVLRSLIFNSFQNRNSRLLHFLR